MTAATLGVATNLALWGESDTLVGELDGYLIALLAVHLQSQSAGLAIPADCDQSTGADFFL